MAKKQFKAESKRLLDLMINSIYTHKEIFLREIISNASDACDKLCYLALTDDGVGLDRGDFRIEITADKEHRLLTVRDNGIGMDAEDLEELKKKLRGEKSRLDSGKGGFGLNNVAQRIRMYYGERASWNIKSIEGMGMVITIKVPVIGQETV